MCTQVVLTIASTLHNEDLDSIKTINVTAIINFFYYAKHVLNVANISFAATMKIILINIFI